MPPGSARHQLLSLGGAILFMSFSCGEYQERCRGPYCECTTDDDCMLSYCYEYPLRNSYCNEAGDCDCTSGHPVSKEGFVDYYYDEFQPLCDPNDSRLYVCNLACQTYVCESYVLTDPACLEGRCVSIPRE